MVALNSSAIKSADYDPATRNLYLSFTSGGNYTYYDVPEWKYLALLSASSAGQYFNENIRDQHSSNR
ncbi:MAG: KTSC domain-containing protein [Hyphomicrobium sp.]|nr:MAG: KTSC domain-containing protein [Hyphomicrobium sp.]